MTSEPERDKLSVLINAASRLMTDVETLAQDAGVQFTELAERSVANKRMAVRNRRLSVWVGMGLLLDLVLSVAFGIGLNQVHKNEQNIGALTDRLNVSQTVTRQKALCPLYQVFLDSESPAGRKAAPDPAKYDQAFKVIREGYNVLKCEEFINQPNPKAPGQP